jgi:hypothetical protein
MAGINILPSIVDGYMYNEIMHSGGFPSALLVESDTMVGGGGHKPLDHMVIPVGLVCDMRVGNKTMEYAKADIHIDYDPLPDSVFDQLFHLVSGKRTSQKLRGKGSKRKSIRIK